MNYYKYKNKSSYSYPYMIDKNPGFRALWSIGHDIVLYDHEILEKQAIIIVLQAIHKSPTGKNPSNITAVYRTPDIARYYEDFHPISRL
jgi:hypothetical protein